MSQKLIIASRPCKFCGGLISWTQKIDGKLPTHVDANGKVLNDGKCPKLTQRAKITSQGAKFYRTIEFNRFGIKEQDSEYTLPIFQKGKALIPRFYIGKISLELNTFKKIIKIPQNLPKNIEWSLGHGLTRKLLEQHQLFTFFRVISESEHDKNRYIHLFIVPHQKLDSTDFNSLVVKILNEIAKKNLFSLSTLVNNDFIKVTITSENINSYANNLKTFFDAIVFKLRYRMEPEKYRTTVHYEIVEKELYYYVDIDSIFEAKGAPATQDDIGKFIYGELKTKNQKYRLIKITNHSVKDHLNTPEYRKFLEYARTQYENQGLPSRKNANEDWSVRDYWEKLNGIVVPENDLITIVEARNDKRFFFPFSRLFKSELADVPKELRFNAIQKAKQELQIIIYRYQTQLVKYRPKIEFLPLSQIVPRYFDLTLDPMVVEFAEGKTVKVKRDQSDPSQLNLIPQELLKEYSGNYKPLAGMFEFLLIPIVPDDLNQDEKSNVSKLTSTIASNLKKYHLSDTVNISPWIIYKFDRNAILERKNNIWGAIFDTYIVPKLKELNNSIDKKSVIVVPLIGLRNLGDASRLFKFYFQNEFYKLLDKDLDKKQFSVIQSFLVNEDEKYKGPKMAIMIYKNTLFNIGANNPHSDVAERIQNGIIFKFKYPFGTKDINRPIESIEMQAGFDASKILGVEHSKPRGAIVVILDPYGKQVKSGFVRNAQTHKGLISESVVRETIVELVKHQNQLIERSIKNSVELPKKIIFLFDGDISSPQKELFLKVYNELIESEEYPILPEFLVIEVLKSHPIRMYLLKETKVFDVPFGSMALLNEKEFVIKSHIWSKSNMAQPQLYRFKMRMSQRYKDVVSYSISDVELINIAVQLFQSTLFNTGKSGRPLKESFVIHESHKLSQEFASKPNSIGILSYKD